MDWSNYAFMNNYLQNWQQYPMLQYGYGPYGTGFNTYNPYGGYQMPIFNYYPSQSLPINFTGGKTQAPAIQNATVTEEKPKMHYVALNETGRIKGSKVYEATPEKVAEYDKKRKSLNTKTSVTQIATLFSLIALGAICGPKILKAINPKAGSYLDDIAKSNIGAQRWCTGAIGSFLGAVGICGEEAVYNSKGKKLVKEYLGEPLNYEA